MRDVCVIGLGLLGGSLLRATAGTGRTAWGAAPEEDAAAARADGYDADTDTEQALRRAAERDALVVLAVPLPALDEALRLVSRHAPQCLLTDVTSVKDPVLTSVRRLVPHARYAGGHPMAGTAESGWAAGSGALFHGATWVACVEEDTDVTAWRETAELALDVGASVCPVSAAEHDNAVARVSHLPHLLAEVLAAVAAAGGPLAATLAAGSFRDGTRVAATRPELVRAMTEGNRDALLGVLDEALGKIGAARGSLASTGGLAATIDAGHAGVTTLAEHARQPCATIHVDLDAGESRDALTTLGARGGLVTAIDGTTATAEVSQCEPRCPPGHR